MSNQIPEGYKINPLYLETKRQRMNIALQLSLHRRLTAAAAKKKISKNEFVREALEAAMKEEVNNENQRISAGIVSV